MIIQELLQLELERSNAIVIAIQQRSGVRGRCVADRLLVGLESLIAENLRAQRRGTGADESQNLSSEEEEKRLLASRSVVKPSRRAQSKL